MSPFSLPLVRGDNSDQLVIKYNIQVTKMWQNYTLNFSGLQESSLTSLIFDLVQYLLCIHSCIGVCSGGVSYSLPLF